MAIFLLMFFPEVAYADDVSAGGTTIGIANAALDAVLVVTAAAMFCAASMVIVQRFLSSNADMISSSYMYKRIAGMMAIMFTICFLARAGTSVADAFNHTGGISWFGSTNEMVVTTHAQSQSTGGWADGTTKTFSELDQSAALEFKAKQIEQSKAQETQGIKDTVTEITGNELIGDIIGGGMANNLHNAEHASDFE